MNKISLMLLLLISWMAGADTEQTPATSTMLSVPYLLAGAPTFDMTISEFRQKYNQLNPELVINEFHTINQSPKGTWLITAASRINNNLYASTALERGTGKVKTIQLTWLPVHGSTRKSDHDKAIAYMAALLRFFEPALSPTESLQQLNGLLKKGKQTHYFTHKEGRLRFTVSDRGDNGLTLAIEPVKLSMNDL